MKQPGPWLAVVSTLDPQTDPELEQLFAAARTAVDPSPESRARVTSAVAAARSRSVSPGAGGSGAEALRRAAGARTGVRASGKWLAAAGALTLALGFWLGHTVGRAEAHLDAAPSLQPSTGAGVAHDDAVGEGTVGDDAVRVLARDPEPLAPSTPIERAPSLAPDPERTPAASASSAPRPRVASSPRARRRGHGAASAQLPPAALSFGEVLAQLRRARAQLDSGQATASLLVLSELDRNAGDLLLEERETTRVLALCAAGQDKAAGAVADRLRETSPRSIYAMRIESSCAAESASDARTPRP
jgi:hypothetical protein